MKNNMSKEKQVELKEKTENGEMVKLKNEFYMYKLLYPQ